MKMERLKRDEAGRYPGAIGNEHKLSAEQCRKVREALAKGPKFLTQIAIETGLVMTHPTKVNALAEYLKYLEIEAREIEPVHEPNRRGRPVFKGYRLNEHGTRMLEVS